MIVRFEEPIERFKEYLPAGAQAFDCKEFELHPWHGMWWELMFCKLVMKFSQWIVPELKKLKETGPRIYINGERIV